MSGKASNFDNCSDIHISGGNFSAVGGNQTNTTNNHTHNTTDSFNTYTNSYNNSGNSTMYYPRYNTQNQNHTYKDGRNFNMGHNAFPNPNQYHPPPPPWMINQQRQPQWEDDYDPMPPRGYSAPPSSSQPFLRNRPNQQFDPMNGFQSNGQKRRRRKPQPQPVYAETGFQANARPPQSSRPQSSRPQSSRYPRHAYQDPNPYPYDPQSEEFSDDEYDEDDYHEEYPSQHDARPYPTQTHTQRPQARDPRTDTMYHDQSSQRNMAAPQPEQPNQHRFKSNNPFASMMQSENGNREREMNSTSAPPEAYYTDMSMEVDEEERGRDPRDYGTQTRRR